MTTQTIEKSGSTLLSKENRAVRISKNGQSFYAVSMVNWRSRREDEEPTVIDGRSYGTLNGAKRFANKFLNA